MYDLTIDCEIGLHLAWYRIKGMVIIDSQMKPRILFHVLFQN